MSGLAGRIAARLDEVDAWEQRIRDEHAYRWRNVHGGPSVEEARDPSGRYLLLDVVLAKANLTAALAFAAALGVEVDE